MICPKCGAENNAHSCFCEKCGVRLNATIENPTINDKNKFLTRIKIIEILSDKLFLVICILISVYVGLSVLLNSVNIITILMLIFCWLAYSNSKKGIADAKGVQHISGTIYFVYIMNYVLCGLVLLATFILAFSVNPINLNKQELFDIFSKNVAEKYYQILEFILNSSEMVFVFGILIAIAILIFNIFGWRNIHCFVKSVYSSAANNSPNYKCCKEARNWLMFFGVSDSLIVLGSAFVTTFYVLLILPLPAVQIIASILINKHFVNPQKNYFE